MKTYNYVVGAMLAVFLVACSSDSTNEPIEENETPIFVEADYTVLLEKNSTLSTQGLTAGSENLEINDNDSFFPGFPSSEIFYNSDNTISLYNTTSGCIGEVLYYNFESEDAIEFDTFGVLGACNVEVTSIAHTDEYVFISFIKDEEGKSDTFYVRIIDLDTDNKDFVDIPVSPKPMAMVPTNDKLFVLTFDEDITDENGISVIDIEDETIVYEKNMGYDVGRMFKNLDGNIVLAYPELHTIVDSSTMTETYTRYDADTAPNFYMSEFVSFGEDGKLYYQMQTEEGTATESIPATYDFSANTAVLYYYENFLSTAQLSVEFEIASTTSIAYDYANDIILVGYKKTGSGNTGGILRITSSPELTFIDNIDLDGIPRSIYVE
ncbi:hypothetical protein J8L85_10900 [Maribacter sp. MMG018]|uniref:hypothetical protein n=1 Tax=Maribacter sp. MMG018 TaxID=2822688 RepID=UPI001B35EAF6|nr:hypothetical protein [Maribacter sp. MMG018]MBQ4914947.1 hypothetical protein [Maribacter sp. MMG018]